MKRNYSREGLLTVYQQEAKDTRDRKIADRQNRVLEERKTLDQINKQLESEKTEKQNIKLQRMNEMKEEYNKMLMKKEEQLENKRKIRKDSHDINGTFKIGADKREIKRINYDQISDALVINPMKENLNNRGGRNEARIDSIPMQKVDEPYIRGKSQGYNIINHSNNENSRMSQNMNRLNEGFNMASYNSNDNQYQLSSTVDNGIDNYTRHNPNLNQNHFVKNENSFHPNMNNDINNFADLNNLRKQHQQYSQDVHKESSKEKFQNPIDIQGVQRIIGNNNLGDELADNQISHDLNNKNFNNNHNINLNQVNNHKEHETDEADFQRYYQEYIKKRLAEEEYKNNMNIMPTSKKDNIYNSNPSPKERNSYNFQPNHNSNTNENNQQDNNKNQIQENIINNHYNQNQIQNYKNNFNSMTDNNPDRINEIQSQMSNININSQNSSEYVRNKQMNQIGFGFNHRSIQNQNYANLENELNVNKESYLSKHKIQENYRHFLDTQVKEKNIIKNFQQAYNTSYTPSQLNKNTNISDNRGTRLKKKDTSINVNPYSTKKYEFGGSRLENNPLTNPTNSYKFNYNPLRQNTINVGPVVITNPIDRNIGSARIRQMGSNLISNS